MQNRIGPWPGHTEQCRERLETEIGKVEGDDTMEKVKERHDHFAEAQIIAGDKRASDPRQADEDEPKPQAQGGEHVDATPSTPAGKQDNAIHFDIDESPVDVGMDDAEIEFEDGPAGSTDRRVRSPVDRKLKLDDELFPEDGPDNA